MSIKNIFVTGAGALVGMGILRSIRGSELGVNIITGDPDYLAPGHVLGDKSYVLEMADSPTYINNLSEIIQEEEIDLLIVGTDIELPVIAESVDIISCPVLISSPEVVEIADSKLKTANFLKEHGFEYAQTAKASNTENLLQLINNFGFPLFIKPNRGRRSIGAKRVNSLKEILDLEEETPGLIVQEYLPETDGEFTSGCLVFNKCKSIITLKRQLRDGNTFRASCDKLNYKGLSDYIVQVANALKPTGPVNFQFRIRDNKPVIFEINARFSGTTPIRTFIGYNEVEHAINFFLYKKDVPPVGELIDATIMRVTGDVLVPNVELEMFKKLGYSEMLPNVSWFLHKDTFTVI